MQASMIRVSAVGLKGLTAYVAHAKGNWGPESEGSDHLQHPLALSDDGGWLICEGSFLGHGEEFKIVVSISGGRAEQKAKKIYGERTSRGAHVNTRFDFDPNHKTLWLLAESHPVVRPGEWNQNNVYFY